MAFSSIMGGGFGPLQVAGLRALRVALLEHYGWWVWGIKRTQPFAVVVLMQCLESVGARR